MSQIFNRDKRLINKNCSDIGIYKRELSPEEVEKGKAEFMKILKENLLF